MFINSNQLMAMLGGRSRSSIQRDIANGRLPKPRKMGGRLYWVEEEVKTLVLALTENGSASKEARL